MAQYRHALLVYPYLREKIHTNFLPPIGLEHIAAAIKPLVRSLTIVDMRFEGRPVGSFLRPDTDLVLLSVNWRSEREVHRRLIDSLPGGLITIAGGRYATQEVELMFESCPGLDIVVRGDGEDTVRELLRRGSPEDVPRVSYRRDGEVIHNGNAPLAPVDDYLWPDRSLRRYKYTIAPGGFDTGIPVDTVASSRGCPFRCKFCTFNTNPFGQKREWSGRSADSLLEELREVKARVVGFTDDIFTWDMDRIGELCEKLLSEGIRKTYIFNARIEMYKRPDVLWLMERAGMRIPLIGIESCHDKTLRAISKGFTVAEVRQAFSVLKRYDFFLHCCFIIGSIGETSEEMLEIARFAREIGCDGISVQRLRCEKYSVLKDVVDSTPEYHIRPGEMGIVYSDMYSPEELRRIGRQVVLRFYTPRQLARIGRKLLRLGIATPQAIFSSILFMLERFLPGRKDRIARRLKRVRRRGPAAYSE
jgi:radical SAM superfamily enzyme YgiQ (UPF0313 family)